MSAAPMAVGGAAAGVAGTAAATVAPDSATFAATDTATRVVGHAARKAAPHIARRAATSAVPTGGTRRARYPVPNISVKATLIAATRAGYGLVELMLSLAIGALLALAASSVLGGVHMAFQHHSAQTRLDDSGRQALASMVRAIGQAGYRAVDGAAPAMAAIAVMGRDASGVGHDTDGIGGPWPPAFNGSDVLAVRFGGAGAGSGDGSITDCAGFAIGEGEQGWSIFYVAAGPDGEGELRCKYRGSSGWGADALVRGVDTLQILYGIDTDDPPDGVPNRYLTATQTAALGAGGDGWRRVASVRIALLLHGAPASRPEGAAALYHLFGSGYTALAGGDDAGVVIDEKALPAAQWQRVRRVVGATVLVRNAGK